MSRKLNNLYLNKIKEEQNNRDNALKQINELKVQINILNENVNIFDSNITKYNEELDKLHGKTKLTNEQRINSFHNDFYYIEDILHDNHFILKSNLFKSMTLYYVKQQKDEDFWYKKLYPKDFYIVNNILAYFSKIKIATIGQPRGRGEYHEDNLHNNDMILPYSDVLKENSRKDEYILTFTILIIENGKLKRKLANLKIETCMYYEDINYVEILYADKNEIIVKIHRDSNNNNDRIISEFFRIYGTIIKNGKEYYNETEDIDMNPNKVNMIELIYNVDFENLKELVDINYDYQICHHPYLCFIAIADKNNINIYSFLYNGLSILKLPEDIIYKINSYITGIKLPMKLLKKIPFKTKENMYDHYEIPKFRMFMDNDKFYYISENLSYQLELFKL